MTYWRIRPVLAVAVLTALAVLTIVVSALLLVWNLRGKEMAHARGETISLSHILAEQTTRTLQNVDLIVQSTRALLAEREAAGEPLSGRSVHELLRGRLSGLPELRGMFIVDSDGAELNGARAFPSARRSLADRDYFKWHKENRGVGLYVGVPTRGRSDGALTLHLSRRLSGPGGTFRGVLAVSLNLGYFDSLYESISFDEISPISLYLANGTLVTRQPHEDSLLAEDLPVPQFQDGADEHTRIELTAQGAERIVTYHRVREFPLLVSVAISKDNVLANWWDKSSLILFGALWVSLLVVFAAWALARELKKEEALAQELKESGERLQGTIDSAMDAIVIIDADQRVVLFNPAAERMFGCTAVDAIGKPLESFIPERFRSTHRRHVEHFGVSGISSRLMAQHMEIVGLRADGQEFPIESTISQVKLHGATLYTAILRDVTDRKMAQELMLESNRQLRQLSGALHDVREEERSRIARELHDELGQQLTGLKMELSWMANKFDESQGGLAQRVEGMKQQIDATIKSVRRIATDLRPTLLDDLGLGAAIEWLAADFSRKTGIDIVVDLAAADRARGDALVTALFRIVQECLTNVVRHAAATQVRISLLQIGATLELKVADNGKGLTEVAASADGGYGLVGIRERAILLGANATFVSHPGAGTEIGIVIPLAGDNTTEHGV